MVSVTREFAHGGPLLVEIVVSRDIWNGVGKEGRKEGRKGGREVKSRASNMQVARTTNASSRKTQDGQHHPTPPPTYKTR